MIKKIFILVLSSFFSNAIVAQTMHSILFVNMEEQGREADRTSEMEQMTAF